MNGKIFTDKEEALAYKEGLEKEKREKARKEQKERELLKSIEKQIDKLQESVKEFEESTGKKTYFINENDELKLKIYQKRNDILDEFLDDVFFNIKL